VNPFYTINASMLAEFIPKLEHALEKHFIRSYMSVNYVFLNCIAIRAQITTAHALEAQLVMKITHIFGLVNKFKNLISKSKNFVYAYPWGVYIIITKRL